jgi:hypothetical protein
VKVMTSVVIVRERRRRRESITQRNKWNRLHASFGFGLIMKYI